ncbi:hypothetical protein DICVIV_07065 [Dictyocaulus viviparus]|uniref:Uncharacterized protein n=1 Tax=Dictyocaulus viviparus TaxID=29172 RepID=A0A0D8XWZ6_DICVI|nr:hypothetical protein DICVIV_07065 [Dictyocaulus viviparus]
MVTRISGVLRTSDSTGSLASNGSEPTDSGTSSSQPSSPHHPTQEVPPSYTHAPWPYLISSGIYKIKKYINPYIIGSSADLMFTNPPFVGRCNTHDYDCGSSLVNYYKLLTVALYLTIHDQ